MSGYLIAVTGLIYAWIAAEQFWRDNPGMWIAYLGYAMANVGLWMLAEYGLGGINPAKETAQWTYTQSSPA